MSFDDDGKTPTSLVRIAKENDRLVGRIEKLLYFQPGAQTVCTRCPDERKNQPMLGLDVIRGVQLNAKGGEWREGKILDPDEGEEYRLVMRLQPNGQVLEIKGYWGMFWRTQYWRRQPS